MVNPSENKENHVYNNTFEDKTVKGDKVLSRRKVKISPSILSLQLEDIANRIKLIEDNIEYIHIDVMDGQFVSNKTNGVEMFETARKVSDKPLDVHLMVENPAEEIEKYRGAEIITFHIESILNKYNNEDEKNYIKVNSEIEAIINNIRLFGSKVGISIKPNTPVKILNDYLDKADLILIMTVEPGYGGQKLIPETLAKIDDLRDIGYKGLIEVDGGVTIENSLKIKEHDIDIIVAGTAIFSSTKEREIINEIKN